MTIHTIHKSRLIRPVYQSEAMRQHIHGPLLGVERPAGEWPLWASVALMFAMGLVGTLLCAAVGA